MLRMADQLWDTSNPTHHKLIILSNITMINDMNSKHAWAHMMTSSNGNISALLALCAPVTGEFPSQRPMTQSFDVSFDLRLE